MAAQTFENGECEQYFSFSELMERAESYFSAPFAALRSPLDYHLLCAHFPIASYSTIFKEQEGYIYPLVINMIICFYDYTAYFAAGMLTLIIIIVYSFQIFIF